MIAIIRLILIIIVSLTTLIFRWITYDPNAWYGQMVCNQCSYQWKARRRTPPGRCARCSSQNVSIIKGDEFQRIKGSTLLVILFIVVAPILGILLLVRTPSSPKNTMPLTGPKDTALSNRNLHTDVMLNRNSSGLTSTNRTSINTNSATRSLARTEEEHAITDEVLKEEIKPKKELNLMAADPITGQWDTTLAIEGSTIHLTLSLELNGDKVTGLTNSGRTQISGRWKDGTLNINLATSNGILVLTGKLNKDKLIGNYDFASQIQGNWEATREG